MHATAFIVGPLSGPGAVLAKMAQTLGFAAVLPYSGIDMAERQARHTPVCYFLFAPVARVASLRTIAEVIRFCPNRWMRFSPMMYFSDHTSVEVISSCINLGFDDVVTLPSTSQRITERLERQVGSSLTYYETATYFGPDRRDRLPPPNRPMENRQGGDFRRIKIVRSFEDGASVVSDDSYSLV